MKEYSNTEKLNLCQKYEDQKRKISLNDFIKQNGIEVDGHIFHDWRDELQESIVREKSYPDEFVTDIAMASSWFLKKWLEEAGAPPAAADLAEGTTALIWSMHNNYPFSQDADLNVECNLIHVIKSVYALNGYFNLENGADFKMENGVELKPAKLMPTMIPREG